MLPVHTVLTVLPVHTVLTVLPVHTVLTVVFHDQHMTLLLGVDMYSV